MFTSVGGNPERSSLGGICRSVKRHSRPGVRVPMGTSDSYRKMAAELRGKALKAPSDAAACQYDALAHAYLRLAEQADQNQEADIWAEFGPRGRLDGEGEGRE